MEGAHDWVDIGVEVIAVISAFVGLIAWTNRKMTKRISDIASALDKRTQNIQSGYRNGGGSLTDVAHSLVELRKSNDAVHDLLAAKVDFVNTRLGDHIAQHDRRTRNDGPPGAERRRS